MYLASPHEIAQRLKDSAKGRGETNLYEYHEWDPRAHGFGTVDRIPVHGGFRRLELKKCLHDSDFRKL